MSAPVASVITAQRQLEGGGFPVRRPPRSPAMHPLLRSAPLRQPGTAGPTRPLLRGAPLRQPGTAGPTRSLLRALPFNLLLVAGCGAIAWAAVQADAQLGLPALAHPAGMVVGALLVAMGLRLRLLATMAYYQHRLAVVRLRPQQRLVTSGVFAHLRNPLLQGWWLLQAGWGLAFGTPSGLLLALALGLALDFWVKWEELTLAAEFGDEYVAYRARTPRWGWRR